MFLFSNSTFQASPTTLCSFTLVVSKSAAYGKEIDIFSVNNSLHKIKPWTRINRN